MILETYVKQPWEVKDYDISYSPWFEGTQDTLDIAEAIVECLDDPADTALQVQQPLMTNSMVKLWVSGGTPEYVYKVTLRVTTVGGRKDESELIFAITEF